MGLEHWLVQGLELLMAQELELVLVHWLVKELGVEMVLGLV
jgi:hypothetical protein